MTDRIIPSALTVSAGRITANLEDRTLGGPVVAFDEVGETNVGPTVFDGRESIDVPADPGEVVLITDHNSADPVGVAVALLESADLIDASFRVRSDGRGDLALLEAAEGVRAGFSVGVDQVVGYWSEGVLHVTASRLRDVSQVATGAFASARVKRIAAQRPTEKEETDMTDLYPPADPAPEAKPKPKPKGDDLVVLEAALEVAPAVVATGAAQVTAGRRPTSGVSVREVARLHFEVLQGRRPFAELQAVLAKTLVANAPGVLPDQYTTEIAQWIRPRQATIENATRQADLPADGMVVHYPAWGTHPSVDLQTPDGAELSSTAATITLEDAAVLTFGGANNISRQVLERSSPDFLEAYYEQQALNFAGDTNGTVVAQIDAAATAVATIDTDDFPTILSKMIAALDPAELPVGGLFCALSWADWAALIGVTGLNGPAYWSGVVNVNTAPDGEVDASLGVLVYCEPQLSAGDYIAGSRTATRVWRDGTTPARLEVAQVGTLSADVGVYGYMASAVTDPAALVKTTPVPAGP